VSDILPRVAAGASSCRGGIAQVVVHAAVQTAQSRARIMVLTCVISTLAHVIPLVDRIVPESSQARETKPCLAG
jgi:hypothetical protein